MAMQLQLFDVPEAQKEMDKPKQNNVDSEDYIPIAKPGDIWQCGKHRVMCGDSLNPDDIECLLKEKKVALIATDPPYGLWEKDWDTEIDINAY